MLALRLAWRNAWRNPRRTGIVVTAVAIGIAGTLLTMAVNFGMVFQMVETAIENEVGHLQIHAAGWEESPELVVRLRDGARASVGELERLDGVRGFARRVRGEGLVSSPRASAGVRVLGIEPQREAEVTNVADSVVSGSYLDGERRRVLLGEELARRLEVGVGDKVVLSVQDLSGELTGEALRVVGIFDTPSQALDRSTVFVRLDTAQALLGLGDAVSEVVAVARSRARVEGLSRELATALPGTEVRTWEELQPLLVYMVDAFDQSAWMIYAAVFVAMAFGIANVLLMTIYERTREIGIMRAIGFGRGRLVATIVIEALVVTGVGLGIGFAVAAASVYALRDGIDLSVVSDGLGYLGVGSRIVPVLRTSDFTTPLWVAGLTAFVASAWPAWRAVRLRPAEAVRHT
jgi:ABC-type lipoprotein release transport system permease subunit